MTSLSKIHTIFKFENICISIIAQGWDFHFLQEFFFFLIYVDSLTEMNFFLICAITEGICVPNHSLLLRESPPEHLFERDSHVHVSSSHETGFLSLYMNANPDISLLGPILVEFAFR